MANRLKMAEHQAIIGLARLNWSYRRIAAELGVDRETVSRHVNAARGDPSGAGPPLQLRSEQADPNAAISIAGSPGSEPEANATISITGSEGLALSSATGSPPAGRRSCCDPWRAVILEKLQQGLTARRTKKRDTRA